MIKSDIMAVIVSFDGGQKLKKTVDALIGQVDHIHVVDNASAPDSVAILEKISRQANVTVSSLTVNMGIGYALNIGVREAREKRYNWLLTMDQDSIVDAEMMHTFISVVNDNPDMVCLTPQYYKQDLEKTEEIQSVEYAITSGNLVRMDVFDKIGLFNEEFFIDCVDFDFSLRVRRAGLNIYQIRDASMHHELGDKVCTFPVIGRFHTFHTPLRRYYIFRNYLYLAQIYAADFPGFIFKFTVIHVIYIVTIAIFGEQRFKSFIYIVNGVIDYFRGKEGPFNNK